VSKNSYPYTSDEFDSVDPKSRPQEVHAARRSTWSRVWPFVVVIIVVPLIAFGVVKVLSMWDNPNPGTTDAAAPPTVTDTVTVTDPPIIPSDAGEVSLGGEPADAPPDPGDGEIGAEETAEAPPLDRTVTVTVLNAKGEAGLAGRAAELLRQDGWATVDAGDYEGDAIEGGSSVYYGKNVWSTSAQSIAGILNIAVVEKDTDGSPDGITVVLRQDFVL
jgi:hypothetical protein